MYHARKTDHNQKDIIAALKQIGASICDLSAVGGGTPDLLVGYQGVSILLEVKNPNGRNRVESNQSQFHASWKGGPVYVVRSPQEAVETCVRVAAGQVAYFQEPERITRPAREYDYSVEVHVREEKQA